MRRKDWNRGMGRKGEMDGWARLDSLARSRLQRKLGMRAFLSFSCTFFFLSLSLFLVASGFSLSVPPFPVSYYLTAFPVFLAVLGSVLFH